MRCALCLRSCSSCRRRAGLFVDWSQYPPPSPRENVPLFQSREVCNRFRVERPPCASAETQAISGRPANGSVRATSPSATLSPNGMHRASGRSSDRRRSATSIRTKITSIRGRTRGQTLRQSKSHGVTSRLRRAIHHRKSLRSAFSAHAFMPLLVRRKWLWDCQSRLRANQQRRREVLG